MIPRPLTVALCVAVLISSTALAADLRNREYRLQTAADGSFTLARGSGAPIRFEPRFTILNTARDPKLELRWGKFQGRDVQYNVSTWLLPSGSSADGRAATETKEQVADGFNPTFDQAAGPGRTPNYFEAAAPIVVTATGAAVSGREMKWTFASHELFDLAASLRLPEGSRSPEVRFELRPKKAGWYSAGFSGAPASAPTDVQDLWQPLIWQERRMPETSYITESYRCPLPAVMAMTKGQTLALVADPAEMPFDPMPTFSNSRFGVLLRNARGHAQPMIFAPLLGGKGSRMEPGAAFAFRVHLTVHSGNTVQAFEREARDLYRYRDVRSNSTTTLNRTLENMIEYAMSDWARWNADLRGSAYDTDVRGSVKNISSLAPLSAALVTDDERIFSDRALPMIEYMLSRERFLFTTDPKVKGQSASWRIGGPACSLSELTSLYRMARKSSKVFLTEAERIWASPRELNLDATLPAGWWHNALEMYSSTSDRKWLDRAVKGADDYIARRVQSPAKDFSDPDSRGMFFWTSYAPHWQELLRLYEEVREPRFLNAAVSSARRFTQFTWTCPTVPQETVTVNKGGKAPQYRANLPPMAAAEETVDAWRVSELGLTCESSGTSKGHRGILLATHAPWMLRLGLLAKDSFLRDVGRNGVVGRYESFPGYHMNTARTTVYEKPDFAHRSMEQLNATTSLHYNHIWAQVAMVIDYLVSDAYEHSGGAVDFPSQYSEGYGYVFSNVYGDRPGRIYEDRDAMLWMPRGVLRTGSVQLNYVAARNGNRLYLVFTNQSTEAVKTSVDLNPDLVRMDRGRSYTARVWENNRRAASLSVRDGGFPVAVGAKGITVVAIDGVQPVARFQQKFAGAPKQWAQDTASNDFGGTRAAILNFGPALTSAYVWLQAAPAAFPAVPGAKLARAEKATLHYTTGGEWKTAADVAYPFEFTARLAPADEQFRFWVETTDASGMASRSPEMVMKRQ